MPSTILPYLHYTHIFICNGVKKRGPLGFLHEYKTPETYFKNKKRFISNIEYRIIVQQDSMSGAPQEGCSQMLRFRGFYILFKCEYVLYFMVSKVVNTEAFGGVFSHLTRVCLQSLIVWGFLRQPDGIRVQPGGVSLYPSQTKG